MRDRLISIIPGVVATALVWAVFWASSPLNWNSGYRLIRADLKPRAKL